MAVAKLTGQGLTAIAISVGLLWGCIIGERLIVQNAKMETSRIIRELRRLRLQRDAQPVAVPAFKLKVPRPAVRALG